MVYERPCRFPADDPDRLWILVAGSPLPYAEAVRWRRVLSGRRKLGPLLSFLLIGMFILEIFGTLPFSGLYWFEILTAFLLLSVATALACVTLGKALRYPRTAEFVQYEMYAADLRRHKAGLRIAFYGDRLTMTSLRGTVTLKFANVQACVETNDGFALSDGTQWLIVRAQDLIAFDVDIIREYLQERVDKSVINVISTARPVLPEPLPIPQLPEPEEALTTAEIPGTLSRDIRKQQHCLLMGVAIPMAASVGIMASVYWRITPWFLADMMILCVGFAVVAWVFASVTFALYRSQRTEEPMILGFEPDGLRITVGGITRFCIKERLYLTADETGVIIRFLNKQTLFIPFDAARDPQILKALAGAPDTAGQ